MNDEGLADVEAVSPFGLTQTVCHSLLAIRGARRLALTVNRNGRAGNAKRACVPWWDDWNERRPPCNRAIRCAVKSPVAT